MEKDHPRIHELTIALEKAERKLADRETLLAAAISQTESARSQYEQANERAEALRRRLATHDEQAAAELSARDQRIASLQQELQQRDERIAILKQLNEEDDNALRAINQDASRHSLANPNERLSAMGLVLESLDEPGVHHRISKATTTLGRAVVNDIAINSASVSRYHARIVTEVDAIYVIDLESTNGCKVNGRRVSRQAISDGDVVAIGDAKFKLKVGVPLASSEDRSMDETFPLLNDSAILIPAPRSKSIAKQSSEATTKKTK